MPNRVTYYAVVDERSNRERPAGLFRRTYTEAGGLRDEAFTRDLVWKSSWSLISAERGDLENEFVEISEEEANQIMEQLRSRWTEQPTANGR
jgi:hypothetical protein